MPELDTLGGEFECSFGSEFNQANIVKVYDFCTFLQTDIIVVVLLTTYIMFFDFTERPASYDQCPGPSAVCRLARGGRFSTAGSRSEDMFMLTLANGLYYDGRDALINRRRRV